MYKDLRDRKPGSRWCYRAREWARDRFVWWGDRARLRGGGFGPIFQVLGVRPRWAGFLFRMTTGRQVRIRSRLELRVLEATFRGEP